MATKAETKQCGECKSDIPTDARKCAHCGSAQGATLGQVVLSILIVVVLVGVALMWLAARMSAGKTAGF